MENDQLENSLKKWLMRRTIPTGIRRVGDFSLALGSDVGLVRDENQDRAVVLRSANENGKNYIIGVLCDGMGGMDSGAKCASLAISSFLNSCYINSFLPPHERMLKATMSANEAVFNLFEGSGGTTLSAFIYENDDSFFGVNVGDSRIYSLSSSLNQLTVDDTLSAQFASKIQEQEYHGRNDLLQYVGIGKDIEPHIIKFIKSEKNTLYLLTSDGIHFLPKDIIYTVAKVAEQPGLIVKRLSDLSKWCGGRDNASLIVFTTDDLLVESSHSNLIEVWDSFGDLQLFDNNKYKEGRKSVDSSPSKNQNLIDAAVDALRNDKNKHPRQRRTSSLSKKPRKQKQKLLDLEIKSENNKSSPGSPKLIVEFEKTENK